jgi:low affinity Fe/Cu permease
MLRNAVPEKPVINGYDCKDVAGPALSLRIECNNRFRRFAQRVAESMGSAWSFFVAAFLIVVWGLTGPVFHYSNTWQLVINTATTIVTFLMVFLIQNTQNRDAKAIHLKLDELIYAIRHARNSLISLEQMTDEELDNLQKEFDRLRSRAERPMPPAPTTKEGSPSPSKFPTRAKHAAA